MEVGRESSIIILVHYIRKFYIHMCNILLIKLTISLQWKTKDSSSSAKMISLNLLIDYTICSKNLVCCFCPPVKYLEQIRAHTINRRQLRTDLLMGSLESVDMGNLQHPSYISRWHTHRLYFNLQVQEDAIWNNDCAKLCKLLLGFKFLIRIVHFVWII